MMMMMNWGNFNCMPFLMPLTTHISLTKVKPRSSRQDSTVLYCIVNFTKTTSANNVQVTYLFRWN